MFTRKILASMMLVSVLCVPALQASETESLFIAAQGKLILPHLNLGNEVYYVQLERLSPQSYDFRLVPQSVTKITPQEGDNWADTADLIGDWAPDDQLTVTLSIEADGTYSLDQPAEDDCTAGLETGLWFYDTDTGVFTVKTLTDANGDCGLSHPEGVARVEKDGADLLLMINEPPEGIFEIRLIRK